MEHSLRVCPIFKFYWVDSANVQVIKRHDFNKPFATPEEIFVVIKEVYSHFDSDQQVVKYRDNDELIDFSKADIITFVFDEKFSKVSFYIFLNKKAAKDFIPPWQTARYKVQGSHEKGDIGRPNGRARTSSVTVVEPEGLKQASKKGIIKDVHPNVECDVCDEPISTARFKCLECTNYDLCGDCKKQGIHTEHLFLMVPICFLESQGSLYNNTVNAIAEAARKCIPHTIE